MLFSRRTRGLVNKSLQTLSTMVIVDGNEILESAVYTGSEPKYAEFVRDINRKYKGASDLRLGGDIHVEKGLYSMPPEKFKQYAEFFAAE